MGDDGEVIQMPLRGTTEEAQENGNPKTMSNGEEDIPLQSVHARKSANEDAESDIHNGKKCNCCPKCCYKTNIVMLNSVITCFAMIISIGILVGLTVTLARPHLIALTYVNGTCTTISANLTGERERCGCGGRFCAADYPCLEIMVEYKGRDGQMIQSMLHEEEHVFTYRSHCSFQPDNCVAGGNDLSVSLYRHRWGIPGRSFPCIHNPNGQGALRRRTRSVMFILHIILWPALCSLIFTLLCCVVYCYCCPRSRVHKFNSEKV